MLSLCLSSPIYGQDSQQKKQNASVERFQTTPAAFSGAKHGGYYYLNIRFDAVPNGSLRETLAQHNIKLLSYQQNNTYRVAVPTQLEKGVLENLGIQKITKPTALKKSAPEILAGYIPAHALRSNNNVAVALVFNENTNNQIINKIIKDHATTVLENLHRNGKTIVVEMTLTEAQQLTQHPAIAYVDFIQEPVSLLNYEVRTNQNVNVLNSSAMGGYGLKGEGVTVGIGDGGELGDHLDFDTRVNNQANGSYSSFGDHGDHVAGIVGGGGHLDSKYQGIAPLSNLITQKTSLVTYYAPDYWEDFQMVLTNNSYGTSFNCDHNGAYNYTSQTLDAQLREYPKMLHVFAAGNSGAQTCAPYPQGYRTVLRYYQSAKNVLTVGNLKKDGTLSAGSSRGPVADGRLKPEICGIGSSVKSTGRTYNYRTKTGTSMSSPAVVGTLALMNEAYRLENRSEIPDGGLMKAIACNTAQDLGNPGPDYFHGFGLINGKRAVETIQNGHFYSNNIVHGLTQQQTITVTPNQEQLNILLYWPDMEADLEASKALVNDLDLVILDPQGNQVLPWVLNPDPAAVDQPAQRGIDTLNNIEQVTISQPMAGVYTIQVSGTNIPSLNQNYYVTYEQQSQNIALTFPFGGESLSPNTTEVIRWEAPVGMASSFTLDYSIDDGNSWTTIDDNVSGTARTHQWIVPNEVTELARVRITANGTTHQNASPFAILPTPTNLAVEALCEGILNVSWDGNSESYELLYFNGTNMESVGQYSQNSIDLDDPRFEIGTEYWISVRAIARQGAASTRSAAIRITPQQTGNCPWANDITLQEIQIAEIGREQTSIALTDQEDITIRVLNQGTDPVNGIDVYYQINQGVIISERITTPIASGDSVLYTFTQKADFQQAGMYMVDAWINSTEDIRTENDSIIGVVTTEQLPNLPVALSPQSPIFEGFQNAQYQNYGTQTLGLTGIEQWDYLANSDQSRLKVSQNSGAIHLEPLANDLDPDYDNHVIWTINLSAFDINSGDLQLDFDYLNDSLVQLSNPTFQDNQVLVRGSDQADWLNLLEVPEGGEDWESLKNINVSQVLSQAGQDPTSSFQLQFKQLDESGFAVDNIQLHQFSVLPVSLTSFKATKLEKDVLLTWDTASELNNHYFNIELAIGEEEIRQNQFETIGSVTGSGTTNIPHHYEFTDKQPNKVGDRYYRLKQVDLDGQYTYSPVILVNFPEAYQVDVYPNPFCNALKIHYQTSTAQTLTIQLVDVQGQTVLSTKRYATEGVQIFDISIDVPLPDGNYYLRIPEDKRFKASRLIKVEN